VVPRADSGTSRLSAAVKYVMQSSGLCFLRRQAARWVEQCLLITTQMFQTDTTASRTFLFAPGATYAFKVNPVRSGTMSSVRMSFTSRNRPKSTTASNADLSNTEISSILPLLSRTPSFRAPFPLLYPFPTRLVVNGNLFVLDFEMYFEKFATCMHEAAAPNRWNVFDNVNSCDI
jgi:hypothetical protein